MRPGPRRSWRNFEATSFTDRIFVTERARVGEADMHVTGLSSGLPKTHSDPGPSFTPVCPSATRMRLGRLSSPSAAVCTNRDHDLAAMYRPHRRCILRAVDHIFIADGTAAWLCFFLFVRGRRCIVWFRHGECRRISPRPANGLEPLLFLFPATDTTTLASTSCCRIGRSAIHGLRSAMRFFASSSAI